MILVFSVGEFFVFRVFMFYCYMLFFWDGFILYLGIGLAKEESKDKGINFFFSREI